MNDRNDGSIGLDRLQRDSPGSAAAAYRDLVVGSPSWLALLHHEVVVAWGGALPGAIGVGFRRLCWRGGLFHRAGRGTMWGRNVGLWHSRKMWIGDGVAVDEGSQLDARGCTAGEFRIGDGVLISRSCIISGKDGPLSIGPRASIGAGCVMYASTRLEIGADTMLAAQCYIGGGRYAVYGRTDVPIAEQPEPRVGVAIGDDCWLGAGVIVIDGAHIGRGCVVAAGSVVKDDVEAYSVVAGSPARRIGSRISRTALEEFA